MQNKKIPLRMCIACKESKPKQDLFRIVRYEDKYSLDISAILMVVEHIFAKIKIVFKKQ